MSHINVICLRVHTTEKKQRRKQGLTVTSARLPSGCPCCCIAATCGHHRWDWAFPNCSHKQRTHCPVSVFSHPPSASMLCVVVALFASFSVGAVLARLLSMSKPISAMYFTIFSPFIAFVKRSLDLNMPRLPKTLAMRYADGR